MKLGQRKKNPFPIFPGASVFCCVGAKGTWELKSFMLKTIPKFSYQKVIYSLVSVWGVALLENALSTSAQGFLTDILF